MKTSKQEYVNRIEKVVHFIEENLVNELDLTTLAREACFSQYHFHRIFSSIMNETPIDYVNRLRVEKAAGGLVYLPDAKISEVAYKSGFSSPVSFTRAFKKHFGLTPSEFKFRKKENRLFNTAGNLITSLKNGEVSPDSVEHESKDDCIKRLLKNLQIKNIDTIEVIYMPCLKGYIMEEIKATWQNLLQWAESNEYLDCNVHKYGIPWDDPSITDVDKCRYYACLTAKPKVNFPEEIQQMRIQGGLHAVYKFEGTIEESERTYNWVYGKWMPQSGYLPLDAPCYEQYFKDPNKEPVGIFRTNIHIPITPIK